MWDRAVKREDRSTQKRLMGSCAERQQDEGDAAEDGCGCTSCGSGHTMPGFLNRQS